MNDVSIPYCRLYKCSGVAIVAGAPPRSLLPIGIHPRQLWVLTDPEQYPSPEDPLGPQRTLPEFLGDSWSVPTTHADDTGY